MSAAMPSADIIVCGIGGQGVMTAADLLTQAAIACGFDCRKSEIAGMAQRGGAVTSQVRIAERVLSPVIGPGGADILLAFELAEALRWADHLKRSGVIVVNTLRVPPPVVSSGLYSYPNEPLAELRAAGIEVHAVDADARAREIGDAKFVNSVMLGAVSRFLPMPAETLETVIVERFGVRKSELAESNRRAFAAGGYSLSIAQSNPRS